MECQRESRRVRLTDQALVAVAIARRTAAASDREPSAVDVLVGLGVEPEGWAGHVLRRREAAMVALSERVGSHPPGGPVLDEVVAAAADRAGPRPPGTRDLLTAVLTVGGADVDDLLDACGYDPADLWLQEDGVDDEGLPLDDELAWSASGETVTLDGPDQPRLSPAASRAVARVRAVAGGAMALVAVLVDEPDLHLDAARRATADRTAEPEPPEGASRDAALGSSAASGEVWDAGLQPVLDAVPVIASGGPASAYHLLQAALIAGGRGPRTRLGLRAPEGG